MQTGPRVASTAARCSAFRPSRIRSASTANHRSRAAVGFVTERARRLWPPAAPTVDVRARLAQALRRALAGARASSCGSRTIDAELRDDLERVALVGKLLELGELPRQPLGVDRRPAQPHDLRMPGVADGLVVAPQLLVQLLARPHADDPIERRSARHLVAGSRGSLPESRIMLRARSRICHRLAHVEHEDLRRDRRSRPPERRATRPPGSS